MGQSIRLVDQELDEAVTHIRAALRLCERLGEDIAVCHLETSADILEGKSAGARAGCEADTAKGSHG